MTDLKLNYENAGSNKSRVWGARRLWGASTRLLDSAASLARCCARAGRSAWGGGFYRSVFIEGQISEGAPFVGRCASQTRDDHAGYRLWFW